MSQDRGAPPDGRIHRVQIYGLIASQCWTVAAAIANWDSGKFARHPSLRLPAMAEHTTANTDDVEVIDGDCTPSDITTTLRRLKFPGNCKVVIRIDREVRDYLIDAMATRRGGK
jgi:hypothetical protein